MERWGTGFSDHFLFERSTENMTDHQGNTVGGGFIGCYHAETPRP